MSLLAIPLRRARRRATSARVSLPSPDPHEEPGDGVDASEGILDGVIPQVGSVRQPGDTDTPQVGSVDVGLAELAARPLVAAHPLARFLAARGVSVTGGARMLGVSRWTLADWIAGRSRPVWWRADEIARALGFADPDDLFPPPL